MGEICVQTGALSSKVIQRCDVQFLMETGRLSGITVVLRNFKNNTDQQLFTLFVPANRLNAVSCPVNLLAEYLRQFGHTSGPLFSVL